ncbi:MAG TPA: T9SS type A sorting domain-containing protein [Flavipsychrobacter sp.]|nr:T9SS type A sorting domain-containing protein [Flavipsychrobacter sp.]
MFNCLSFKAYKDIICTFILIIFSIVCNAQAPGIIWAKTYGGTKGDFGNCIQNTSNNGYIIAGSTYSNDGNVTGFHGGSNPDFWIINLKDSNIVWEEALGGSDVDIAYSIATTTDGGYIAAGTTSSNDGDVKGLHGNEDMWIVRLSSGGAILWQKCLGGSRGDGAYAIQQTTDGGYIVAGTTNSTDGDVTGLHDTTAGYNDMWVVKLDDTGAIIWQKCLGGSYSELAYSIQQTKDGGYIVAGFTNSDDGDVAGLHSASGVLGDYWIVKLNDTGGIQWQKCLGGSLDDQAYSIQQTKDGGYIIAGMTYSTDGDVTGNRGNGDAWIVKLTDSGNINWERCYGGTSIDVAYSIQQTIDSGYIIAGITRSNDGDVHGNHGDDDYWTIKLASAGGIEWQKCLGGSYVDDASWITQNSDGSYVVIGTTLSVDGEVTGLRDSTFTDQDGDIWVVKLDKDTVTDTITSVATISMHDVIKVYPTIVSDGTVHINMPQGLEHAAVRVTNMSGQVESVIGDKNGIDRVINLNNLPDGEYVLQVVNKGKVYSYRIVIRKE